MESRCAWKAWAIGRGPELGDEDRRALCGLLSREAGGWSRVTDAIRGWEGGVAPVEEVRKYLSAAQGDPPTCEEIRDRYPDVCEGCPGRGIPVHAVSESEEFPSIQTILERGIPPVSWTVPGVMPQGLSFLAGKPKMMKSYTALHLCCAVATGGVWMGGSCGKTRGASLYLSLEDPMRRVARRAEALLGWFLPAADLSVVCDAPRLGDGCARMLERWISSRGKEARLIVIDTWAMVRPMGGAGRTGYERDYGDLQALKHVSDESGVSIVIVHHTTKAIDGDPLDAIHGTTGALGAVDGAYVLYRPSKANGEVRLKGVHRDLPEDVDLPLRWDMARARYDVIRGDHGGASRETTHPRRRGELHTAENGSGWYPSRRKS